MGRSFPFIHGVRMQGEVKRGYEWGMGLHMRGFLSVTLAVTIGLLLLNCSPSRHKALDSMMYSWAGQHRDDLVRAWGPPVREMQSTTGGSLLIYHSEERTSDEPGDATFRGMLQRCRVEVETDPSGKIVMWRYQSQCY